VKLLMADVDLKTVESFGDEWSRFDQSGLTPDEAERIFRAYFAVFPWEELPDDPEGFDMGCGTGRWARLVAPRVGTLHCIDPSSALEVARRNLKGFNNVEFHHASVAAPGIAQASQDFGYCLGVLHHVPDTEAGIYSCSQLLKPGAPFLIYLYYAFDNRPSWFRNLWKVSDELRKLIIRLPPEGKHTITNLIATFVYWPLARVSRLLESLGIDVHNFPLSSYRKCSFYTMRTDSRDRFGTPLEKRFTREQIESMMTAAGFTNIRFSEDAPYWVAVGTKT
jgi:SAM-dependent methyltransferase